MKKKNTKGKISLGKSNKSLSKKDKKKEKNALKKNTKNNDYGFGSVTIFGRTINKVRLFNMVSLSVIIFFTLFYGARLAYYLGKQIAKEKSEVLLCDALLDKESVVDLTTGLVKNEKNSTYVFKGKANNNYLMYSGRMYRIVGLDADKNIKIISNSSETSMIAGIGHDYKKSSLRKWLNEIDGIDNSGVYFKSLNDGYKYLTNTKIYLDKIEDIEKITSNELFTDDYVSLLSLSDYKEAGGANSYLNNSQIWFLDTTNTSGVYWYASTDGGLNLASDASFCSGIRPVMTIKNSTLVISGDGTKSNPYKIEKDKMPSTVYEANVGSFISYGGYTWKIIEKDETKTKLALNGYLTSGSDSKEVTNIFGKSVKYSADKKGSLGYYLNNDFYNTLSDKSLLVKDKWYNGKFTSLNSYSYLDCYKSSFNGYVGVLKIGDMFLNEYEDSFTMTGAYGDDKLIYTVSKNNSLYADFVSNKHKIRPAIYIKSDSNINSGDGSSENPYEIK